MEMIAMERLPITDASHIAAARRQVATIAVKAGFNEADTGRVAIVCTELANNILRHGGGGEVLAGPDPFVSNGIELLALDRGPGMADVEACLRDGYSTAGTPGTGLGAAQRMAEETIIHSHPGDGTAILVRFRRRGDAPAIPRRDHAALSIAKPGEVICGDTAEIIVAPDGQVALLVADGLGHGPLAAAASREAARLFRGLPPGPPVNALPILHAGLRPTRGAAIAAALINPAAHTVTFAGIGNIGGFVIDGQGARRMVSHAGTAGQNARRLQEFAYPFGAAATIVLYSDGLTSSWAPDHHRALFRRDPMLIAGVLYRDHARGRDDATVVVWKG